MHDKHRALSGWASLTTCEVEHDGVLYLTCSLMVCSVALQRISQQAVHLPAWPHPDMRAGSATGQLHWQPSVADQGAGRDGAEPGQLHD